MRMGMSMSMGMGMGVGSSSEDEPVQPDVTTFQVTARPEGSAPGPTDDTVYISEVILGGVKLLNIETGEEQQVVPSNPSRAAVGLATFENAIFVAGGGEPLFATPSIHVYDAVTGEDIVSCFPDGALFVNDLAIVGGYLYATCSINPVLMKFDVGALLAGECVMESIPLTPAIDFTADLENELNASNGIAPYGKGVIICTYGFGSVYYLNLETYETSQLVDGELPLADGVLVDKNTLYILTNLGIIVEYNLTGMDNPTVELVRVIANEAFETLATASFAGEKLVAMDLTPSVEFGVDFDETNLMTFKVHVVDV